jgi:UDP-N-acetyl-D-mannosaminuronic acid dehydrogenase
MKPGVDRVCVVGLGYIGLPTAAAFATQGLEVVGVDTNPRVVDAVNRGESPIAEPDLATVISGVVAKGKLRAQSEPDVADAYVLAVPTPFAPGHVPDLTYVHAATDAIAPHLRPGALVVLESTSPPGTTLEISRRIAAARPDLRLPHTDVDDPDVAIAHCPERVLPGRIMIEIVTNDRVVGGVTAHCAERARDLYELFCQGDILLTDSTTAELVKLSENAYRDVNIAFANEMAFICDHLGIDPWEVISLANRHPRVDILQPGPGVGGHCIAVDPWFIVHAAPQEARLIRLAREVNDAKPGYVVDQIADMAARFRDPVIACLGLAFKANVDDLRESPAVQIVAEVARRNLGSVLVVEPFIESLPTLLSDLPIKLVDLETAVDQADIVVGLVDHDAFKAIKQASLRGKVAYDTRGMWR